MTFYQKNRARMLACARECRERNRGTINAKQRERYAAKPEYREYQRNYQAAYYKQYGRDQRKGYQ